MHLSMFQQLYERVNETFSENLVEDVLWWSNDMEGNNEQVLIQMCLVMLLYVNPEMNSLMTTTPNKQERTICQKMCLVQLLQRIAIGRYYTKPQAILQE